MRLLLLPILIFLAACTSPPPEQFAVADSESFTQYMSGSDTAGYKRAVEPRDFSFPEDHGPHWGYKTEWWYITGNLSAENGHRFGYQITFFKTAIAADSAGLEDAWEFSNIYMAHLGLSDITNEQFYSYERFQRGAAGLAGAQTTPFRVWLDNWSLQQTEPFSATRFSVRFNAETEQAAITLDYRALKEAVLQGEKGLSQKGRGAGNASYYYSYTRLATSGQILLNGQSYEVDGLSWMDREWSTSALEEQQAGWDWFALQLDDGTDIMYYQLRFKNGDVDSLSRGTWVNADNSYETINYKDMQLTALEYATAGSGTRYPLKWRMQIPGRQMNITVSATFTDQEHRHSFRYWEGAVIVGGTVAGAPVSGSGYLEMTGY